LLGHVSVVREVLQKLVHSSGVSILDGLTENDGHENDGPSKLQDIKM